MGRNGGIGLHIVSLRSAFLFWQMALLISSAGLREGNPLSPLLFVIVIEALSKMLSTTVDVALSQAFL